MTDFNFTHGVPSVIAGKGTEIDAMMQTLKYLKDMTSETRYMDLVDDTSRTLLEGLGKIENQLTQDERITQFLSFARAYYSSDSHTTGDLGCVEIGRAHV